LFCESRCGEDQLGSAGGAERVAEVALEGNDRLVFQIVAEESILPHLNARRVRRMSDYVKLTLAATALATRDAGVEANAEFLESCSVILGSTHGAANYCHSY
jgi:3-oxoacyl-(acyl-carrier-protein) synthase